MPGPRRIEYENAWYHIMNPRQIIFKHDTHKKMVIDLLDETYLLKLSRYRMIMLNHNPDIRQAIETILDNLDLNL